MDRLRPRGILLIGVLASLAGCAGMQRTPVSTSQGPFTTASARAPRFSDPYLAGRGGDGGASSVVDRYFPGLNRAAAPSTSTAPVSRFGTGLFARRNQHALPASARHLTPTGARLAQQSPNAGRQPVSLPATAASPALAAANERETAPTAEAAEPARPTSTAATALAAAVRTQPVADVAQAQGRRRSEPVEVASDEDAPLLPVALDLRAYPGEPAIDNQPMLAEAADDAPPPPSDEDLLAELSWPAGTTTGGESSAAPDLDLPIGPEAPEDDLLADLDDDAVQLPIDTEIDMDDLLAGVELPAEGDGEMISMAEEARSLAMSEPLPPRTPEVESVYATNPEVLGRLDDRARRAHADAEASRPARPFLDVNDLTAESAQIADRAAAANPLPDPLADLVLPTDSVASPGDLMAATEPATNLDREPATSPSIAESAPTALVEPPPADTTAGEDPTLVGRPRLPVVRYSDEAPAPAPAVETAPRAVAGVVTHDGLPPVEFPATYYGHDRGAAARQPELPAAEESFRSRLARRVRRLNPFRDRGEAAPATPPVARGPQQAIPATSSAVPPSDGSVARTATVAEPEAQPPAAAPRPPLVVNGFAHHPDCPCAVNHGMPATTRWSRR